MALAAAVQGGLRPSQQITWLRADGTPEDLTGATLTGRIQDAAGTARAIAGGLVVVDPTAGVFRWDYHGTDVATAGLYQVQFKATFLAAPTPALTTSASWEVQPAI
jgi:hypothetical protein